MGGGGCTIQHHGAKEGLTDQRNEPRRAVDGGGDGSNELGRGRTTERIVLKVQMVKYRTLVTCSCSCS